MNRGELLKQKDVFCTECGASLRNFCISKGADDLEAIKQSLAQCKKSGKFAGEFCAKLFIGDSSLHDSLWEKELEE